MSFEENIKQWVLLDNQIKQINDQTKQLKQQKNNIENIILTYVEHNNMNNVTARITGGCLGFVKTKHTATITLKFLHQCLSECIKNPAQLEQIENYIKGKREIKHIKEIKRYYDKE